MSEPEKDALMEIGDDVDLKDPNLYPSSDNSETHGSKGEESKRKALDVEAAQLQKKRKVEEHQLQISRVTEKEVHVGNDQDINGVEDDNSTVEPPSRKEALKAAVTLNNYLRHHEKTLPEEVLTMLRKVQDEIQGSNGDDSKGSGDAIRDDFGEHVSGSKGKESKFHAETDIEEFLGKTVPKPKGCKIGCVLCGEWGHSNMRCPFLEYFPKGTRIHPRYETMCKGCDRIGSVCCDKGGYAEIKFCPYCNESGHWVWEDIDYCLKPKDKAQPIPQYFRDILGESE